MSTTSVSRSPRRRARTVLLGFVIVVAAVALGLVAAVLIGIPRSSDPVAAGSASESAEPSAAASDPEPTVAPTPKPTAAPTPSPTPEPIRFAVGTVARVTVNALNLRQTADASSALVTRMPADTELYVTGQSLEVGDLVWYPVAASVEPDPTDCFPCDVQVGWAATPASGTEAWLNESFVDCPVEPLTVDLLIPMTPFERLHCFGNREFVATGWADSPCCGFIAPYEWAPAWLAYPTSPWFRGSDFYSLIPFRIPQTHHEDGTRKWANGDILRFTGHFDDTAASDCSVTTTSDEVTARLPDPAAFVFECRLRLVITEFEIIGHEGEEGCGCLLPPSPTPGATMPRGGIRV